jgi:hypothetical protein
MPNTPKVQVTLYTRPGCHLCDDARREMLAANYQDLYSLREINIDSDPALTRRYGWEIPVVAINGVDTFKYRLTSAEFKREIRGAHGSNI